MIKIAIVGGKLQGMEALYLAQKAGFETLLVDKKSTAPAIGLANRFLCSDVLKKEQTLIDELEKVDLVLPALEKDDVLNALSELAEEYELNLAFDLKAYSISSSKKRSDELMLNNNIPAPSYYPSCEAPYIMKPSTGSGSQDVKYIDSEAILQTMFLNDGILDDCIIQEYLEGRSYSIEVIGKPGNYKTYEVTEIHMDEGYDCKRVTAPVDISDDMKCHFSDIATDLANILKLNGIMDVEVIENKGVLKVLEIDARIPSQTPTVVYHSSGINLLEELVNLFSTKEVKTAAKQNKKYVAYEHLLIDDKSIKAQGEHIMGAVKKIKLLTEFCGADEVLTDYEQGKRIFRGTFINISETEEGLSEKRNNMIEEINKLKGRKLKYLDLSS